MANLYKSENGTLVTYNYPLNSPACEQFKLLINNQQVFIYKTNIAYFACFSFKGLTQIEVQATQQINEVIIRPQSKKIASTISGNTLNFSISESCNLNIDINQELPLLIFANPLETQVPSKDDKNVLFFEEGKSYDVGELSLKSNQTLYIEGGAVIKGSILTSNQKNITVCGRGILDGTPSKGRLAIFGECENVNIHDIIMIEPASWMLVLGNCTDVLISNIKQLGSVISSDGIDVVGSKNVKITGCYIKNNDDCVVIKALNFAGHTAYNNDMENVLVENCVFANGPCGNAMEIGYELRNDSIKNIVFRNIDVLSVHGQGAVFSIHNGDRSTIENVLYEDIRIEHYYDKLIDFRILTSKYNKDEMRGHVKNIRFKNIYATASIHNPGHSISIIGGFDENHIIDGVTIEDFYINNNKITNCDQLDLYIKEANNVVFK